MNEIATLHESWLFDFKGNLIQSKTLLGKSKANEIYRIAKEALYHVKFIEKGEFKRV